MDTGQIQRIASEYLQELVQYYVESQSAPATASPNNGSPIANMLEQRVHELLNAMTQAGSPQEKRDNIIRVLCNHQKRASSNIVSCSDSRT